jgi:hypothetical protein
VKPLSIRTPGLRYEKIEKRTTIKRLLESGAKYDQPTLNAVVTVENASGDPFFIATKKGEAESQQFVVLVVPPRMVLRLLICREWVASHQSNLA